MNLELRLETPADHHETEEVAREAFWNHYSPGCNEHYLVHIMRGNPAFVAGLNFVAADGGRIVGHIAYLKTIIKGDDEKEYEVLSLGPLSVLPDCQRRGVGRRLIEHTKMMARDMGFRAILLFGDPAYYSRLGFIPAERFGLRTADDMYAAAHLVCPLYENALAGVKGRHLEDAVYEIDEATAAEFDENFPAKEKISGVQSQKRFDELAAMRKKAL